MCRYVSLASAFGYAAFMWMLVMQAEQKQPFEVFAQSGSFQQLECQLRAALNSCISFDSNLWRQKVEAKSNSY